MPSAERQAAFSGAIEPLSFTSGMFRHINDEELIEAIGFDPTDVNQILSSGSWPPETITLLRGGLNIDSLPQAWEASGYTQETTASGDTVWTIGPKGEIDESNLIQSRVFAEFNNVTILSGDIVAFGPTLEVIENVIITQTPGVHAALDNAGIAPLLLTLPDTVASLMAFDQPIMDYDAMVEMFLANPNVRDEDAQSLTAEWEQLFAESRETVGSLPAYSGSLFGITSGLVREGLLATPVTDGDDVQEDGHVLIRLAARTEEDAEQIARVVKWRWNHWLSQRTLRPYADLMTLTQATSERPIAIFDLEPIGNPAIWMTMLNSWDILPFVPDGT